jgi:hypothetical protein
MRGQLNDKNSFTSVVTGAVFEDEDTENEYAFNGTVWKFRSGKFASGDTKPTQAETNATITETDTLKTFDYDGTTWNERSGGGATPTDSLTISGTTLPLSTWLLI